MATDAQMGLLYSGTWDKSERKCKQCFCKKYVAVCSRHGEKIVNQLLC